MLQSQQLVGFARPPLARAPALMLLKRMGLTANLEQLHDLGDASSYASGQSLLDLSGHGYDYFFGTTSGSEASDPTFNGTAGALTTSENLSSDGADLLTYDGANETFMQNMHKDNAALTLIAVANPTGGSQGLMGTLGNSNSKIGLQWNINTANGNMAVTVGNGSGTAAYTATNNVGTAPGAIQFFALVIDEANGTGFMQRNSAITALTPTYSSPSASAATHAMQMMAVGNSQLPFQNGSKLYMDAIFSAPLPQTQTRAIFNALRGRFSM